MVNSHAKGYRHERLVADYMAAEMGDDRIIRPQHAGAARDRGDVANVRVAGHRIVIEAKNAARLELAAWLDEAVREAANDGALLGVVVHKRRGKGAAADQYATLRLGDLVALLRLVGGPGEDGPTSIERPLP